MVVLAVEEGLIGSQGPLKAPEHYQVPEALR